MEKLKFIGYGGATNVKLGGNCSYIIDNDNLLIIDACEEATNKLLKNKVFRNIKNVYIAITHTHYDHVGGLGVLIWYLAYELKIIPKIIYNDETYKKTLSELFSITGVKEKTYNFIHEKDLKLSFKVNMLPTTHTDDLQCFGIMFTDKLGKYYYTGDTNDIEFIKKLSSDDSVKTIYCEVSEDSPKKHIVLNDLLNLNKKKFILMHFTSNKVYKKAKRNSFKTAK